MITYVQQKLKFGITNGISSAIGIEITREAFERTESQRLDTGKRSRKIKMFSIQDHLHSLE